ncbi:MAG: XRE family transcriptional regulator [Thermodesulfobacteriota bacterium]
MNLGSLLRQRRKEKKLTLRIVAEKAGVSEGFMSQVENNVKSPSLETLMNICAALEVGVGDLFNQLQNKERLHLIRKSEWEEVDLPHTGFATRRFCTPEDRTVIDSAILFLEPTKTIPVRKNIKNGQEVLCLLKGTLELVQGDRTAVLHEGDTAHFWSDLENQRITNTGDETVIALWVGTL